MHKYLTDTIKEKTALTEKEILHALDIQKKKGGRIGETLIRLKHVKAEDVLQALGDKFSIPYKDEIKEAEIEQELA